MGGGGGGGGGKLYLFKVDVTHNYVHTSPLPSYYWSYYTGACGTSVLAQLDNISLVAMLSSHGVRMRYGQNISQVQRQDKSMISDLYIHTRANYKLVKRTNVRTRAQCKDYYFPGLTKMAGRKYCSLMNIIKYPVNQEIQNCACQTFCYRIFYFIT